MPTYGYRLHITSPDMSPGTRQLQRVEFDARDRATAETMLDGWAVVSGQTIAERELIADGMTFRERMVWDLTALGGSMRKRFHVIMDGPVSWEDGEALVAQARLWLPNGRGVSLTSKLDKGNAYVDTEMFPIRREPTERDGWELDGAGVMEYSARTGLDGSEVASVLEALAKLK